MLAMPCRDINELTPVVRRGAIEFLKRCKQAGLNVLITQTYRSIEYQNKLYAQGRTAPGSIVTNCKGGSSPHNFRYAFDICKNVKGHEYDDNNFFKQCGKIWQAMGGEWGGAWSSFEDKPHFQYGAGLTDSKLRKGAKIPDSAKMPWETDSNTQPKKEEAPEVVDKTKLKIEDKVYEVSRILVDGNNFVKLQDLKAAGFLIEFDNINKMPVIYLPKK